MKLQKANRTHTPPPTIENLGDGTYYYNFNVDESEIPSESTEDVYSSYDYMQVRLHLPVNATEIQETLNQLNIDHNVKI